MHATRSSARTGLRTVAPKAFRTKRAAEPRARFQTTQAGTGPGFGAAHLASGAAGGAIVLLGGYAYYHKSGMKSVVDTAHSAKGYLVQAQGTLAEKAKNPNEALKQLRSFVRAYVGMIPGASAYVDSTFDNLEDLSETHGEEAGKIISSTYEEISDLMRKGGKDSATAGKVLDVLRKRSLELAEVAKKASGDLMDKYPQAKEKLSGGWDSFSKLAEEKGPEAKKVYNDTSKQVKELLAKGVNSDSIEEAKKLIEKKTKELRNFAGSKVDGFDGFGAFESLIKQVPGGEKALQQAPNLSALATAAQSQSEDAKKLAEETYQDLLKVLKEKSEKAKQIVDGAKDETKDNS